MPRACTTTTAPTCIRSSVTYNHCHNGAAELIGAVECFEALANHDPPALMDRLTFRTSLDPRQEKCRIS